MDLFAKAGISKGKFTLWEYFFKGLVVVGFIFGFIALIVAVVVQNKLESSSNNVISIQQTSTVETVPYYRPDNNQRVIKTCRHLNTQTSPSGVYTIKPTATSVPFPAYCEMIDAGGGWTLVASIHENNIYGKCKVGDKWSSEQGIQTYYDPNILGNWENNNVFGSVGSITSQDYKNPAYMDMQASDVMIWHVANETPLQNISNKARFKYYTDSHFLRRYGNTLKSMFNNRIPIKKPITSLTPLMKRINATSVNTTSLLTGWYNYTYDRRGRFHYRIQDGGRDMYDSGNMVYYGQNGGSMTRMTYNKDYFSFSDETEITSSATYPFLALAWIGNTRRNLKTFEFKVISNYGADGGGNFITYNTTTVNSPSGYTAKYTAFHVYGAGSDPSICEVYFYIGHRERWHSRFPTALLRRTWGTSTSFATNTVSVIGTPENILFGYTLLSKSRGGFVTAADIANVLMEYMKSTVYFEYRNSNAAITTPFSFIKGNAALMNDTIPYWERGNVYFDEMQFRAYNRNGLPSVFCPGFRTNSTRCERICVGGINTYIESRYTSYCGDYGGWASFSVNQTSPTNSSKSMQDIKSTILIFTK